MSAVSFLLVVNKYFRSCISLLWVTLTSMEWFKTRSCRPSEEEQGQSSELKLVCVLVYITIVHAHCVVWGITDAAAILLFAYTCSSINDEKTAWERKNSHCGKKLMPPTCLKRVLMKLMPCCLKYSPAFRSEHKCLTDYMYMTLFSCCLWSGCGCRGRGCGWVGACVLLLIGFTSMYKFCLFASL